MKPSISLLLLLLGVACAADNAKVFILNGVERTSVDTPTISSVEAGLVLVQRLGVSQYHKLHEASKNALKYINSYGRDYQPLFSDKVESIPGQLIIVAEGWTPALQKEFDSTYGPLKPAFNIASPPPEAANKKFLDDVSVQMTSAKQRSCSLTDAISPYSNCWDGPNKVLHVDFKDLTLKDEFLQLKSLVTKYISSEALELILLAMPESSRKSRSISSPYGVYDMPSKTRSRRVAIEEPMADLEEQSAKEVQVTNPVISLAGNNTVLKGIIPFCHASIDSCISATNNCSGHGSCYKKYEGEDDACFTCGCIPDFHKDGSKTKTIYWGGGACQKKDISAQFWLIATFVVVLTGLVSWAIGMMFAIGEEKLPGVIGAGVSGPKSGRS